MYAPQPSLIPSFYRKATPSKSTARAKLRRMVSLAVMICLFSSSVPAAPRVFADFAGWVRPGFQIPESVVVSWLGAKALPQGQGRGMPPAPINPPGVQPPSPESRPQREARIASLVINPAGDVTLESRQRVLFTAIPVDGEGNTIQGLSAEWESSNQQIVFVRRNGEAIAGRPGTAVLRVRVGQVRQTVRVTVEPGDLDEFGGRKKPDSSQSGSLELSSAKGVGAQATRKKRGRHHLSRTVSTAPMPVWNPNEDPLADADSYTLYLASNAVGSPPGMKKGGALTPAAATSGGEMGNQNFSFALPVVSLPGRGIDASLSLSYNSQVWHKSTGRVTFDVDSGWPAAGLRLGYGQIENQGTYGLTLVEADGTRHELKKPTYYSTEFDSVDGTFLHYSGSVGYGTLSYPDGTRVTYGAAGGGYRGYPMKITDPNGNYILINYVSSVGPKISTIQDTLARYIRFYYASNGDLVTITQPGFTGELQVMRFYYDDVTIPTSGLFTGVSVTNPASSTLHTLKYIYLPSATESASAHIGYKFDYSAYGMIYQIKQFRGMTLNPTTMSLTSPGTVSSDGSQAAITTYNYPTTASNLSDVPTYSTRTDDWAGRTTGMPGTGNAPYYSFATSTGSGEKTSTVTAPDDTIVETHSIDNSGAWNDGLVKETKVKYGSTTLSATNITWEQTPSYGPPRVASVKVTDDGSTPRTKATVFSYTTYNNVSVVSERDFTSDPTALGTELRRTETTYVASTNYTNRRIYRLPSTVKVFPGGPSTPAASRIDYAYDNYGTSHANLTARNDIIMHDPAYDPFQQTQEIECHSVCDDFDPDLGCLNWDWVCTYYNPYDSTTDYRGNVTSVTTYPDATSTSGTITRSMTYDIAGNVMSAEADCCQQKSFTYSGAGSGGNHDYAYPISVINGSSGTTLTTGTTYDYNTGVIATATDESSQVTNFYYNADSLRIEHVSYPDSGQTAYVYSDALAADANGKYHYYFGTSTKLDAPGGTPRYIDSYRHMDGRGAVGRTFDDAASDGWITQDTEYDVMGRAYRVSNPYYSASSSSSINPDGFWTSSTFDRLDRVTQLTMPRGDNNNSLTTSALSAYNGVYTTVTDQAGKVRRQKVDALGRVIRLDEPTTSGLGSEDTPNQTTNYTYDVLDNLVRVNQSSQDRYFKYDSLSRLIRERQVEQATNSSYDLSDSLTGNSAWSRKIDYNSSSMVTHAYDARSVHTKFSYDGLNRVTQIEYLKPGSGTEVPEGTPTAHYFYDSQTLPSGAPTYTHGSATGRMIAMTYGSTSATTGTYFGYDTMGRINVQKQVTGSTTYGLSYSYNTGGMLTGETYPSGRALTYAYDEGGRLSSVGDGTTTFANGFQYVSHGGLKSETWGNGAVHSMDYNRRFQPTEVKLKQSSSGSELQRYNYSYGEVTQSSGSVDTSKNNGQIGRIDGFINGASTRNGTSGLRMTSWGGCRPPRNINRATTASRLGRCSTRSIVTAIAFSRAATIPESPTPR